MSWDSYIDYLLDHCKGNAERVGIIGLDGSKWTTDGHVSALKIQGSEAANIASCFKSKDFSQFMANGIVAEGVKYQFLREEDGQLVLGKKKDYGAITLQASKTAIVICHSVVGTTQEYVNKGVSVIVEYLESVGM